MELSERQEHLLSFVKRHHGEQKRKYTFEPYWTHVYSVAKTVSQYETEGLEIAFCHDLLEDTECKEEELFQQLVEIGYEKQEAERICSGVVDLTDQYTHEAYPKLSRKERKILEAKRLGTISELSQSVKYADLIDNARSIVHNDPGFAKVYLREKMDILDQMRKGNIKLLVRCCYTLQKSLDELDKLKQKA